MKKILSNGKEVPVSSIFAQAKVIGVSKRTVENVKRELGVKSIKNGVTWLWKMEKKRTWQHRKPWGINTAKAPHFCGVAFFIC